MEDKVQFVVVVFCACAPDPGRCSRLLLPKIRSNRKMWAVVKRSCMSFYEEGPHTADPRSPTFTVHFSRFTEMFKGHSTTGSHRTILLVEDSKTVRLKFSHRWVRKIWSKAIQAALNDCIEDPDGKPGWAGNHMHVSFAPVRRFSQKVDSEISRARWLVDGNDYFAAVFSALQNAESQIFIQGWWVAANLVLLRPGNFDDETKTLLGIFERKGRARCSHFYFDVQCSGTCSSIECELPRKGI